MEIQGDVAKLFAGIPIIVPGANVAVTQPKVKDIVAFGEDDFFLAVQLFLSADKMAEKIKQGNTRLEFLSDFQVLLVVLDEDKESREAIGRFFELIFPDYEYEFAPGSVNFKVDGRTVGQLNPMDFEAFQTVLKNCFIPLGKNDGQEQEYNPANEAAAAIAAKLKRGNEIRAQMKAKDNNTSSLFATYVSALSIGLAMDINVLLQYTPFQLYDAFRRYNMKEACDFYKKICSTPLMDASKMDEPENWLGDMYVDNRD